jgi:hypothetical protein
VVERFCEACGLVLERRPNEFASNFAKRKTCDVRCADKIRWKNRDRLGVPLEDRFWTSVRIGAADECWEWTGAKDASGYGEITFRRRVLKAHRIALELAGYDIRGVFSLHECDNPGCVNVHPKHVRPGTHQENMDGMVARGRSTRGERNPGAKLSASQVEEIRTRCARGEKQKDVGAAFGVGPGVRL